MNIRLATISDAIYIARLAEQLGYPTTELEMEERLKGLLGRAGNAVIVAESADGAVVGWAHVHASHRLMSRPSAELGGLVVDETSRSKGVGKALMEAVERWAANQGYDTLRVKSNVVRKRAHDFYYRLGYNRTKQQSVLEKRLIEEEASSD
jgi:GNAT superfamily N-acetyltransferase